MDTELQPIDPSTTVHNDADEEGIANPNYEEEEEGAHGGLDPSELNRPSLRNYGNPSTSTPKAPGSETIELDRLTKNVVNETSTSHGAGLPFTEPSSEAIERLNKLMDTVLEEKGTAVERIQRAFNKEYRPKETSFIPEIEDGKVFFKWTRGGKEYRHMILDQDNESNEKLFKDREKNKTIQKELGNPTFEEVENHNRRIRGLHVRERNEALDIATTLEGQAREAVREKEIIIRRLQRELEIAETNYNIARSQGATREVTAEYNDQARRIDNRLREMEGILEEAIDRLKDVEQVREQVEERLTLKEKIKRIFKKHGFTVVAVVTSVGVVIGAIVSNLAKGLGTVARGVGNALKGLGKKIGQILPGMVGAIASFIFRTAGQVVGLLGKHAWLLIMAVVLFFVEQFKNKRR